MAREFTVSVGNQTVGANTLVFINPAAAPNVGIRILRCWASQAANATSAQQRVQLVRQVTAFPTLVSATPRPLKSADTIASIIVGNTTGAAGTCGVNASAEGAGAKTVIVEDAFNVLNGYLWTPSMNGSSNELLELPAGSASGFGLFLPIAPTTTTGWSFGVTFAEF